MPERQYVCRVCGESFTSRASGNKPEYCGPDCYKERRRQISATKPKRRVDHPERPCERCGTAFKPRTKAVRFCKEPKCVAVRTAEKSKRHHQRRIEVPEGVDPDEYKRDWHLKKKYGITLVEWREILASQGGRCAICGGSDDLVVDHCHANGHVRGALCRRCNAGIGYFLEDVERLRSAVEYIQSTKLGRVGSRDSSIGVDEG